jgi:hypothetical protein
MSYNGTYNIKIYVFCIISAIKILFMKKFILIFALLLGLTTMRAQNVSYVTAYEVAIKIDGCWSEWQPCKVPIKVDLDNDKITIYSNEVQIYSVIGDAETPPDNNGQQIAFIVIDQDGDRGRFRFRVQNNGVKQVYVDFNNISWCYSVK